MEHRHYIGMMVSSWNKEIFGATGFHDEQIKLNLSQLLIEENRYNVDLNSDGQVGDRISQTLSNQNKASHATGLYKTVSGAYVFDQNNLMLVVNFNHHQAL